MAEDHGAVTDWYRRVPELHSSWKHLCNDYLGSAAWTPHFEHPRASWEAWHGSPPSQER